MLIQKRNAQTRDYSITAIPSSNPFSVSPRTMTTEIACHDWKASKTLSRGDSTRQGVKRLTEALRGLSRPITRVYRSIGSPYQSDCINGYRQGSHSVINQRDSSNVPSHQVSLRLQAIENHSQKGHQVTMTLQCKRTIVQTYYRTLVPSHQVSLQLQYTCTIEPSQSRASVQTYYSSDVL